MKGVLVGRVPSVGKVAITFMSPDDDSFTKEFTVDEAKELSALILLEVTEIMTVDHA